MERGIFLYFPALITFTLFSFLIAWTLYGLKKRRLQIGKKELAILGVLFFLALLIRIKAPFMTGSGGGEEFRYVLLGKEIAETGRFIAPRDIILNKYPVLYLKPYFTYPAMLAIPSFFLETTRSLGIYVNTVFGALTVFAVYFMTKEFFSNKETVFLAAVLAVVLPLNIHLSNTTESQILSFFFFCLFLTSLMKYLENNQFYWSLGTALLFIAFLFSRTANWIFLPFLIFVVAVYRRKEIFEKKNILSAFLIISFLIVPFLMNLRYKAHKKSAIGAQFFTKNFSMFIRYIFQEEPYYGVLFILGSIGFIYCIKKYDKKKNLIFSLPFFIYFLFILSYRWGISSLIRYYYLPLFYLSIWSSVALFGIYEQLEEKLGSMGRWLPKIFLISVVGLLGIWCVSSALNFQPDIEYPSAKEMVEKTKEMHPECTIFPAEDPRPLQLAGYKVLNPWYHDKEDFANLSWYRKNLNSSCLLYYKARLRVDVENETPSQLREFEDRFEMELLFEKRYGENLQSVYLVNLTKGRK